MTKDTTTTTCRGRATGTCRICRIWNRPNHLSTKHLPADTWWRARNSTRNFSIRFGHFYRTKNWERSVFTVLFVSNILRWTNMGIADRFISFLKHICSTYKDYVNYIFWNAFHYRRKSCESYLTFVKFTWNMHLKMFNFIFFSDFRATGNICCAWCSPIRMRAHFIALTSTSTLGPMNSMLV